MNDGELSLLRLIDQKIDRLQTSFDRHDESDDRRFATQDTRIQALEMADLVNRERDNTERLKETRWHNWQIGLLGVIGVIAAAVISSVLTAHLTVGLNQ